MEWCGILYDEMGVISEGAARCSDKGYARSVHLPTQTQTQTQLFSRSWLAWIVSFLVSETKELRKLRKMETKGLRGWTKENGNYGTKETKELRKLRKMETKAKSNSRQLV